MGGQRGFAPVIYILIVILIGGVSLLTFKAFHRTLSNNIPTGPVTMNADTPSPPPNPTGTFKPVASNNPNSSLPISTPISFPSTTPTATPLTSGSAFNDGNITSDTLSLNVRLSRSNAFGGRVYGQGVNIHSINAVGITVLNTDGKSGQGVEFFVGGVALGSTTYIRSNITTDKPNGTYTGSDTVYYTTNPGSVQHMGPVITYTINLVD